MDYANIIVNVPRVLFRLGENVKKTPVKPFRILRNKSWYGYIQGTLSKDDMIKEMTVTFKATEEEIIQTINSICTAATLDLQVWEKLKQLKYHGKKVIGLFTIAASEYSQINKNDPFDTGIFDVLWHLSDFSSGTPDLNFWNEVIKTGEISPAETIVIDRELEIFPFSSVFGIRSIFLDDQNRLLNMITPDEKIIRDISTYLEKEFPEGYNKTLIRYAETNKEVITPEPYAPLLLWSLLPEAVPPVVVDKLKLLGKKERINFFENEKDIQAFNTLPYDIDTSSVFLGTTYENGALSKDVAERELDRILTNVNSSGILLLYFDKYRPRIEPAAIINVIYLANLLNRQHDPVIRENQHFVEKILLNKGWEHGTYFYPSPEFFLLVTFRLVRRFNNVISKAFRDGLMSGLAHRTGAISNPLELGIRLIISKWLGINNTADRTSLLLQRIDRPGFQWEASPLYSLPSAIGSMYNPLFDAAIIKSAL